MQEIRFVFAQFCRSTALWGWTLLMPLACTGTLAPSGEQLVAGETSGSGASSGTSPEQGQAGAAALGEAGAFNGGDAMLEPSDDPGTKGIHRLNSREYDRTLRDLLGIQSQPARDFLNETAHGFDNIAASLGMTSSQYAAYFRAAEQVAREAFEDAELRAAIVSCDLERDDECAADFVAEFGQRALRRPLMDEEQVSYLEAYGRALDLGLAPEEAAEHVVRAMLASAEFLYRIEFDADPASREPHPVSGYEMASRLSYFLWGSMPDARLFEAAAQGELNQDEGLQGQVTRMLDDEAAASLVDSFAWQWLGLKTLESHAVLSDAYPEWDEALRGSMLGEARLYLSEFVQGSVPWESFFTEDVRFVDQRLAEHYDMDPAADFERRQGSADGRVGFLGLGAFLTSSSFAHRTSPTLRAKWILEELLCSPPPPPPSTVDSAALDTDDLANQAAEIENVRERLELHRSDPGCATCHRYLDPMGLALENFDAIGRYRTHYDNGDPVDATGELPDGTLLEGLGNVADVVQSDPRFFECTAEKLMTYALGRGMTENDAAHLALLVQRWQAADARFPTLVRGVIDSLPFRQRRGGDN